MYVLWKDHIEIIINITSPYNSNQVYCKTCSLINSYYYIDDFCNPACHFRPKVSDYINYQSSMEIITYSLCAIVCTPALPIIVTCIGVAALQTMVRQDCRRTVFKTNIIHAQIEIHNYNNY